jgi:two-component system, NarL family, response regulator DegU
MKLLFDNSTLFGETLARVLGKGGETELIEKQFNEKNIVEIIKKYKPNIVLIDTDSCVEMAPLITKTVKKDFPKMKIISLYLWDRNLLQQKMIDAGVDNHLSKLEHSIKIVEMIKNSKLCNVLF